MRGKRDGALRGRAKALRTGQTPAEAKSWQHLRAGRVSRKISRQVVVGPYIVDFAARSAKLAIELDGDTHGAQLEYDARRTLYLEQQGYRVIRFTNAEVAANIEGVLVVIAAALAASSATLPDPLPAGGEREP